MRLKASPALKGLKKKSVSGGSFLRGMEVKEKLKR